MNTELIMPVQYIGETNGITAIVFGLDNTISYNKIILYLQDDEDKKNTVYIDNSNPLQTTSATFNNLIKNKYYTVVALIQYADGTKKTIDAPIPAEQSHVSTVSNFGISLLSSSEFGSGGQPTGGEVEKPSTRPSLSYSSLTPIYTTIKNQKYYETCVADSLSTAMSVFKAKATNKSVLENYSISYIYGSDGRSDIEYMMFEEAVEACETYGSPRWELFQGIESDEDWKSQAIENFNNAQSDDIITSNALKQRFASHERVNFYDSTTVYNYIKNYGYFMFNFKIPTNFYSVANGGEVTTDGIIPQPPSSQLTRSSTYSGANHSIALIGLTTINNKKYWIAQNSWGTEWGKNGIGFLPIDFGYDSSEYWVLDSYGIEPGSGYSATHPNAPNITSVQQVEQDKIVELIWGSSGTNVEYIVFSRATDSERWWRKTTTSTLTSNISVDYYKEYEFMILSMQNSYCSEQSEIMTVSVTGNDLEPLNIQYSATNPSRVDNIYKFSWGGAASANGFNVTLECKNGTDMRSQTVSSKQCSFPKLLLGKVYVLGVQAFNDFGVGEIIYYTFITTPPNAVIDLKYISSEQKIAINYEIDQTVTHISVAITQTSSISYNPERLSVGSITGSVTPDYKVVSGETYKIYFSCEVYSREYDIWSQSPSIVGISLTINDERPRDWEWPARYVDAITGDIVTISPNAIIPIDSKGIHPVTYTEWNNFLDRIVEFRNYAISKGIYVTNMNKNVLKVSRYDDFTPEVYNQAVNLIKDISGYGGYLNEINNNTQLSAYLFTILQDELNAILKIK